jgi:hypothetical protein
MRGKTSLAAIRQVARHMEDAVEIINGNMV